LFSNKNYAHIIIDHYTLPFHCHIKSRQHPSQRTRTNPLSLLTASSLAEASLLFQAAHVRYTGMGEGYVALAMLCVDVFTATRIAGNGRKGIG
jgi:hypothetical protein